MGAVSGEHLMLRGAVFELWESSSFVSHELLIGQAEVGLHRRLDLVFIGVISPLFIGHVSGCAGL